MRHIYDAVSASSWKCTETLRAVIVVFAGYMGSVAVVTTVKWFWFTFSLVALVFVLFSIARTFKDAAVVRGGAIASLYGQLAALILISWIFYPVTVRLFCSLFSASRLS
jgi:bacteriorhodopsin